jgi:hypothetical protein
MTELIESRVRCSTVKKRIERDFEYGYLKEDFFLSYNPETGEYVKKIEGYDLKFKINVINNYEKCYQIGAFIRTIVALLTKIHTNKIMIIIDMSSYNNIGNINIRRIIDKLIYVSTSSVILTNVFLVLPNVVLNNKLFLKQKKQNLLANGITIIDIPYMNKLIDNYTEFDITLNGKKIKHNLFNKFNSTKNYISVTYEENVFTNMYSPIIYQLASYNLETLQTLSTKKVSKLYDKVEESIQSNKRLFVMCIEKISNIHRIDQLMEYYCLDNIIICLPPKSNDNYEGIVKYCQEYDIKYYEYDQVLKIISESDYKNIVAVDMHKEAISIEYNKSIDELNDSILIFGYELSGIPKEFLELSKTYIQIESRKSVNVVAALSIILSSIY